MKKSFTTEDTRLNREKVGMLNGKRQITTGKLCDIMMQRPNPVLVIIREWELTQALHELQKLSIQQKDAVIADNIHRGTIKLSVYVDEDTICNISVGECYVREISDCNVYYFAGILQPEIVNGRVEDYRVMPAVSGCLGYVNEATFVFRDAYPRRDPFSTRFNP